MVIDSDILLERGRLKRRVKTWRLLTITIATALIITVTGTYVKTPLPHHSDYIAYVDISGIINPSREIIQSLEDIGEDQNAKAVLLAIESPGGTAVGGEMLYESVARIQQQKPVVALMHNIATSAGYMVALPAERIYAHKGTITGSIGVILQSPNVSELSQKIGITMDTVKTGQLKGEPSPFDQMSPEGREVMQAMVNNFYDFFVQTILDNRPIQREQLLSLADGRVFTGLQAQQYNLIDAIGGENEALAWLHKQKDIDPAIKVRKVKLEKERSPLQELLGSWGYDFPVFSGHFSSGGLLSIWKNTVTY